MNNLAQEGYCDMKITVAVSRISAWKGMSSDDLPKENYVSGQQHTGTSMRNP